MQIRQLSLIFNNDQSEFQKIDLEILQDLLILSILFLIYIQYLFLKIQLLYSCKISSFIDNVAIYVKNKTIA